MCSLEYHHRELVSFLREVKGTTPELSFIALGTLERKLLNLIIDAGDKQVQQVDAAESIGVKAPHLRKKVQFNLNKLLKVFSDRCGIKPPIQLFFNTAGDYPGGHFACCKVEDNASKSNDFIRSEDLQNLLENARQVLRLGPIVIKTNGANEQEPDNEADTAVNSKTNQIENNYSNTSNHKGHENMENESLKRLYMQLTNELQEIQKAMVKAYDEKSANMFQQMWELKNKQLIELEIKLHRSTLLKDHSPKHIKELRKKFGLGKESG